MISLLENSSKNWYHLKLSLGSLVTLFLAWNVLTWKIELGLIKALFEKTTRLYAQVIVWSSSHAGELCNAGLGYRRFEAPPPKVKTEAAAAARLEAQAKKHAQAQA